MLSPGHAADVIVDARNPRTQLFQDGRPEIDDGGAPFQADGNAAWPSVAIPQCHEHFGVLTVALAPDDTDHLDPEVMFAQDVAYETTELVQTEGHIFSLNDATAVPRTVELAGPLVELPGPLYRAFRGSSGHGSIRPSRRLSKVVATSCCGADRS